MRIRVLNNESELLAQVAGGSEKAFAAIFDCYRDKIYSVAYRLTDSSFIAEEIVQDVFLKIWLKREMLTEIREFEDYLFITARNHVFSALKRNARQQTLVDDWVQDMPSIDNSTYNKIVSDEVEQIIQQAVEMLPPQQKQVYILSKEQEMKRDEIAKELHISSETVKTHLSRALRHIRAFCVARLDVSISWWLFILLN